MNIQDARKLFPVRENQLYFNHAACSPFSVRVEKVLLEYLKERVKSKIDDYQGIMQVSDQLRKMLGKMMNASADRIALTTNTSHGLNIIASGFPWEDGDEILISEMEFPANVYPFLNLEKRGVKLAWFPTEDGRVTLHDIETHLTSKTKMLTLSYVQYLNGYRADLKAIGELCKERNIWFVVDGIQGMGAFPMDVQNWHIDALAGGGQKWMMSPKGTGYLYLTEELQAQLDMSYLGWLSVENPFDFHNFKQDLDASAQRFELATANAMGIFGMHTAVELLLEVGIPQISEHILDITGYLRNRLEAIGCEILTPFEDQERAGIMLFSLGDESHNKEVFQELLDKNVTISLREGKLRVSPHFYNTREDLDKFLAILQQVR